MKYRWFIGAGIISVILTGCNTDSLEFVISASNEIQQSQAAEQNSPAPSEVQMNVPAANDTTVITEENKQKEIKLPEELLINGWKVGVPFSAVVNMLPHDVELTEDMQYCFKSKDLSLYFTWGGILDYILTREQGKGLSIGLNIGDDEQKIKNLLGETTQLWTTSENYLGYIYSLDTYDITIFTKNGLIQYITMSLSERPTIDETEKIRKYYNEYIAATNSEQPEKPHAAEQLTMKYTTREELIALRNDFFKQHIK